MCLLNSVTSTQLYLRMRRWISWSMASIIDGDGVLLCMPLAAVGGLRGARSAGAWLSKVRAR